MLEEFKGITKWYAQGRKFVIATVIQTWGSAPRLAGSLMAISDRGEIIGSVSGGCVEGDVIRNSKKVIENGEIIKLNYGVADEEAWLVGLTCGGKIEVWLEPMWEVSVWDILVRNMQSGISSALVTNGKNQSLIYHDSVAGDKIDSQLLNETHSCLQSFKSKLVVDYTEPYFVNVFRSRSKLLIIGAAHISTHLVQLGSLMGFETIIIDPRGLFAEKQQFAVPPDKTYGEWPAEVLNDIELDNNTFAVLLSHDPKIDDQALHILLESNIPYIGALGSKKTHAKRVERLKSAGFSSEQVERIHGPVGIDINAKLPGEIALSIISQITAIRNN